MTLVLSSPWLRAEIALDRTSHNSKLQIGQHIDAADRYLWLEGTVAGTVDKDRREHRAILEAALAGDPETAAQLMTQHLGGTGREMAALLQARQSAHGSQA